MASAAWSVEAPMCGVQVTSGGQFLVGPGGLAAGRLALEHVQSDAQPLLGDGRPQGLRYRPAARARC